MVIGQRLIRFDDLRQVRFHELRHHVNLIEACTVLWLQNALDSQDVLVVEKPLNLELAIGPQREDAVLKSLNDLLDGDKVRLSALASGKAVSLAATTTP